MFFFFSMGFNATDRPLLHLIRARARDAPFLFLSNGSSLTNFVFSKNKKIYFIVYTIWCVAHQKCTTCKTKYLFKKQKKKYIK